MLLNLGALKTHFAKKGNLYGGYVTGKVLCEAPFCVDVELLMLDLVLLFIQNVVLLCYPLISLYFRSIFCRAKKKRLLEKMTFC